MNGIRATLACWLVVLAGLVACTRSTGGNGGDAGYGGEEPCDVTDPCSGCGGLSASGCDSYCGYCGESLEDLYPSDPVGGYCTEEAYTAAVALDTCICEGTADSQPPGCSHLCVASSQFCMAHPTPECQACIQSTCAAQLAECELN